MKTSGIKPLLLAITAVAAALLGTSCNQKTESDSFGYVIQVSIGEWNDLYFDPDKVIERIDEVSSLIPVEKVMVGWVLDAEVYRKIGDYLHGKGIPMILYLPVFSETEAMIEPHPAVDLWGNLPAQDMMDKVSGFRFNCPGDGYSVDSIIAIYEKYFEDLGFDGVFLDRIRTQSFVGGVSGAFECSCPTCAALYREQGVDLEAVKAEYEKVGDKFFSVSGYTPQQGFDFTNEIAAAYFAAKGKVVSSEVCRLADYFHGRGLEVGLDLFAPIVAQFVGQDYSLLAQHVDFIKPMLYRITDAPAGIGYEYDLVRASVPDADGYAPLVMDCEFLKGQLEAMEGLPCDKFPGIEINRVDGIVNSTPEYLQESIAALKEYGCRGAVLSWNIMQAPDENIQCLKSLGQQSE